ncbi:MAG: cytochrome c-type biogenesis protein CcmH [Hyphomonadaceae bacterium]
MIAALAALIGAAVAPLASPALEARAQALDAEIRCVTCENEPISQSTADIAQDMRRVVRERIAAGDSDAQIRAYFRDRYGDFVLLRPPWDARTWLLWAAPAGLVLIGGAAAALALRARQPPPPPEEGER